ncbi:DUF389 domain-containing protein [Jannaschia sp. R86511]|uniref:DUF389 domain-containing protein n=1 Tax=Jannaschia sp. R86511 TaxID=3093853 RepID=UPI0036D3EF04
MDRAAPSWRARGTDALLPPSQRRSLDDLSADLDLSSGDHRAKRSAFWTMLTLSAVIAAAGVLADSTATVIGAMIIAPLSTPIMGVALGVARRRSRVTAGSLLTTGLGAALVVLIGVGFALVVPDTYDLTGNSQVTGRVTPGLLDLVAAVATGFAGAVGLARKDVAAVLPGVAIAISLVPPLAVVGVCAGQGRADLALGALLLFVSNLLALVLAGTLVFTALELDRQARLPGRSPRRAYATIGGLLVIVAGVLAANTAGTILVELWTARVSLAAEQWVADAPDVEVTGVELTSTTAVVRVRTTGEVPASQDLLALLEQGEWLPDLSVSVETTEGRRIPAGTIGGG